MLPLSLSTMPGLVLSDIFGRSDFRSLMVLRKTSHPFRNFIDELKPEGNFRFVGVHLRDNSALLHYTNTDDDEQLIEYERNENGCRVRFIEQETQVDGRTHFEVLRDDLRFILAFQGQCLLSFKIAGKDQTGEVTYNQELESIGNVIQNSKPIPLKVTEFFIEAVNQEQVLHILPRLDAELLRTITIANELDQEVKPVIGIDTIRTLNQWARCEVLWISNCFVPAEEINNFAHFEKVEIETETINPGLADY